MDALPPLLPRDYVLLWDTTNGLTTYLNAIENVLFIDDKDIYYKISENDYEDYEGNPVNIFRINPKFMICRKEDVSLIKNYISNPLATVVLAMDLKKDFMYPKVDPLIELLSTRKARGIFILPHFMTRAVERLEDWLRFNYRLGIRYFLSPSKDIQDEIKEYFMKKKAIEEKYMYVQMWEPQFSLDDPLFDRVVAIENGMSIRILPNKEGAFFVVKDLIQLFGKFHKIMERTHQWPAKVYVKEIDPDNEFYKDYLTFMELQKKFIWIK